MKAVGAKAIKDDSDPFEAKMKRLTPTLREQQSQAANSMPRLATP